MAVREWFTSDEHYGHANIIAFERRPFADARAMEDGLVERHNAVVRDGDVVWHVGDFSLDRRQVRRVLPRLRGRHRLVAGNHDGCHCCHRKHASEKRWYEVNGFAEVHCGPEVVYHPAGFDLCHLPYAPRQQSEPAEARETGHELRYLELRPADEGRWLVHGHVHSAWRTKRRMINVGVDVRGYAPVSLDELVEEIRAARAAEECFA